MRVVMLGAPGAGKGTQSDLAAEKYGIPHISSGALFRKNIGEGTELGKKVKDIIEKGQLVPDSIVIDMILDRISADDCQKGFILDGFPRTVAQAEALQESLKKAGKPLSGAINLFVPDEVIKSRMTTRVVCPKCEAQYNTISNPPKMKGICDRCGSELVGRADDNEETVSNRLSVYHRETEPIIDYYKANGILIEVDGTVTPDEVYAQLVKVMDQLA